MKQATPSNGKRASKPEDQRRPQVEELEPRILLSADPLSSHADPEDLAALDASEPAAHVEVLATEDVAAEREILARRELVIVDAGVDDHELLVSALQSSRAAGGGFEVAVLDPGRDGVEQISEILASYESLDAVHIISHGSDGVVKLGSGSLAADNLDAQASAIAGWGDSLTLDADLLFYGCELADSEMGKALVDSIA